MNEEERAKIDLEAPFSLEEKKEENQVVTPEPVAEPKEPVVQEPKEPDDRRVPQSRFETMRQRALEAAEEAAYWRGQAEARSQESPFQEPTQMPQWWLDTYGDNEAARRMWELDQKRVQSLKQELLEDARKEATETLRREREEESSRLVENESLIDQNLDELSDTLGRRLTSEEEDSLLGIVDEYTPKDVHGNYAGPTIPFDKAWEIYELRKGKTNQPTNNARNRVSGIISTKTSDASVKAEEDKNWDPLHWRSRIDQIT